LTFVTSQLRVFEGSCFPTPGDITAGKLNILHTGRPVATQAGPMSAPKILRSSQKKLSENYLTARVGFGPGRNPTPCSKGGGFDDEIYEHVGYLTALDLGEAFVENGW
jgi:hypothetical protein